MYYKLERSTNLMIIGNSIQIQKGIYPINIETDPLSSKNFGYEYADLNKLIFPQPVLEQSAKLTDFISCNIVGTRSMPLISNKLQKVILENKYTGIQFIPAIIFFQNQTINNYFFLNAYQFYFEGIDFEKSTISYSSYKLKESNPIKNINNLNDFLNFERSLKPPLGVKINPVYFNENINKFDFFSLRRIDGGIGYYVSGDLKNQFENVGITGIDYVPLV